MLACTRAPCGRQASDGETLREGLVDDADYHLVPDDAWHRLVTWYGSDDRLAVPIPRCVVPGSGKTNMVEVYPLRLTVEATLDEKDDTTMSFVVHAPRRTRSGFVVSSAVTAYLDALDKKLETPPPLRLSDLAVSSDLEQSHGTVTVTHDPKLYSAAHATVGVLKLLPGTALSLTTMKIAVS